MRQILLNSNGAVVARVPRPTVERGVVLVRVQYSLISVGTELAPLRSVGSAAPTARRSNAAIEYASLARHYLRASLARSAEGDGPRRRRSRERRIAPASPATDRAGHAGRRRRRSVPGRRPAPRPTSRSRRRRVIWSRTRRRPATRSCPRRLPWPTDSVPVVRVRGRVDDGAIAIGLLNEGRDAWIGSRTYEPGPFEDTLIFDPQGSRAVTVVVTTAGAPGRSRVTLETVDVGIGADDHRRPAVERARPQGWNVGYSAAGEVVAVGEGIDRSGGRAISWRARAPGRRTTPTTSS